MTDPTWLQHTYPDEWPEPEEPRFHKEHLWIVGILSAVIASGVTALFT